VYRSVYSIAFFFCGIRNSAVNATPRGCAGMIAANTARLDSYRLASARLDSTRFISVSWLTGRCPAADAHDAPFITECSRRVSDLARPGSPSGRFPTPRVVRFCLGCEYRGCAIGNNSLLLRLLPPSTTSPSLFGSVYYRSLRDYYHCARSTPTYHVAAVRRE